MQHFSTRRLIARDWTTADAESAFAIYGRDEVARYFGVTLELFRIRGEAREPGGEAG